MAEWGKIGMQWKKLMDGDSAADVTARVNAPVGNTGDSGKGARNAGGERLHERIEEIQKRVQERVHGGGGEGLGAKIEEYKKQARERAEENGEERKEREEERQDAIPDLARLGAYLDKTRDMVNERMKEVKGDEKKLAKARRVYPKVLEQVKKHIEEARDENGEFDPKALFPLPIPKEGQESLKAGIKAGKEGIKRGKGEVDDGEGRDQGIQKGREGTRRGLEEMKEYIGKRGSDGHNPEQAIPRKRNAKL